MLINIERHPESYFKFCLLDENKGPNDWDIHLYIVICYLNIFSNNMFRIFIHCQLKIEQKNYLIHKSWHKNTIIWKIGFSYILSNTDNLISNYCIFCVNFFRVKLLFCSETCCKKLYFQIANNYVDYGAPWSFLPLF